MVWPTRELGTLATIARGSSPRPIADTRYFEGGTIPWIKIADATKSGKFLYETKEHVNEFGASFSKLHPPGTILVAASGTLGYTQILGVAGCAHDGWLILKDLNGLDRDFAYYALKTLEKHFFNSAYGAAIQNINTEILRKTPIPCPGLSTQRRIGAILAAYDDLIENNTRRIAVLEEVAQLIYEEWFVRFRFPGHEKLEKVESEVGLVPKGWAVIPVTDAIAVNPSVRIAKEGIKPFVPMGCLSNGSMLITNVEVREGNSGSKFQNGDTLFARITPCLENGKTGYVQFLPNASAVAFGSTEFIVLRTKTVCPEYTYLLARSESFRDNAIKSMSGASGRQRVKEACFNTFLIAQPDTIRLEQFQQVISPMFKMVNTLDQKNANLSTTRDLLLPKLISGELDVTALPELEAVAV